MASKSSIIATNVAGVNEIILDNKTGLLVEENNEFDLADNIIKLKEDITLRNLLVKEADKFIHKQFNLELMYKNYERRIKDII